MTSTYKQGIYDISKFSGYMGTVKSTTPDKIVTVIVVDRSGMLKGYTIFGNDKEQIKAGPVVEGDKIIIVGDGKIAISAFK